MAEEILSQAGLQPQDSQWIVGGGEAINTPEAIFFSEGMTEAQVAEAWAIIDAMSESASRMEDSVGQLQSHIEGMGRKIDEMSRLLKIARAEDVHA